MQQNTNVFLLISLLIILNNPLYTQRIVQEYSLDNVAKSFTYVMTMPEEYDKNQSYPVLLVPGAKDDPNIYIGKKAHQFGWIIIESGINIQGIDHANALIKAVQKEVKVDKFVILGFSANSAGAFEIGMTFPEHIEAIIGMPGHPRGRAEQLEKLKKQKILFIVGEKDPYWLKSARNVKKQLQELAIQVKLEVIPNGGHVLKELVGEPFFDLIKYLR